ncbi:GPP34 family phosphoprotein [Polymorphospora sp. NPDC050346]|uniref:GOLPH3/VPS74 family protein n=1 Tax=Polymorphospora sp. NPDC050346 TaxID=3155780 RepID=UPI0033F46421
MPPTPDKPLIAEDLLLLLFDPASGSIAGEGTLFYVLGGALLTELALDRQIDIDERTGLRGRLVHVVGSTVPTDPLLRSARDHVAQKPRDVQAILAAIGPRLRAPVLDRLVRGGHVRRERRKVLGLFTRTALRDGGTPHRPELLARVRAVLVDGAAPDPRTAAICALISASGTLPTFHRDIPWSTPVITRAKELERGDWGAEAAAAAVARTMAATVANALVAANVLPKN